MNFLLFTLMYLVALSYLSIRLLRLNSLSRGQSTFLKSIASPCLSPKFRNGFQRLCVLVVSQTNALTTKPSLVFSI